MPYYLCTVVGSGVAPDGVDGDPFRPVIAGMGVAWHMVADARLDIGATAGLTVVYCSAAVAGEGVVLLATDDGRLTQEGRDLAQTKLQEVADTLPEPFGVDLTAVEYVQDLIDLATPLLLGAPR